MAYTGILGTGASYLGNFVLGSGDGGAPVYSVGATNTLSMSQSATVSVTYNLAPSNTFTPTHLAAQVFPVTPNNTIVFTGLATNVLIPNTSVGNTLTMTQSATPNPAYARSVTSTFVPTQVASGPRILPRSADNTWVPTDFAVKVIEADAENTLTLTHTATCIKFKSASANNSIVLVSTVAKSVDFVRTLSQGFVVTQSVAKSISRVLSPAQTLNLTQSAVGVSSKLASNTLTLSQSAVGLRSYGARNSIVLTQIASVTLFLVKSMHSNFEPFQVVRVNGTFRRSLESEITFTQSVAFQLVRPVANTLNLTNIALGVSAKGTFSELAFTQSTTNTKTVGCLGESDLLVGQTVSVIKSRARGATSILGFNQSARGTRRLTVSAANTITFVGDLVRERTIANLSQTLTITQTALGPKRAPRSVLSNLPLTQSVSVSKTYVRSVGNTLVFKNSFQRYIAINGGQVITVPAIQVVKVKRLVILQSAGSVIVLPTPEFNDKEGGTGRINIKRAMDGTRRIYKRDSPTSKLVYDFVMDRKKAIELRTFLLANNSLTLTMTNWKGEIWAVILTNNPFQFTEEARWDSTWGNKSQISLEFEGVKLN